MNRSSSIVVSLLAWAGVWAFWLIVTRDFHPTWALALVVTTSLIIAYATAAYLNHLVLIPRLWSKGRRGQYVLALLLTMVFLNAVALTVIRVAYTQWWGTDPDPYGIPRHFTIDLFGMAVHLTLAAVIVALWRRFVLIPPEAK